MQGKTNRITLGKGDSGRKNKHQVSEVWADLNEWMDGPIFPSKYHESSLPQIYCLVLPIFELCRFSVTCFFSSCNRKVLRFIHVDMLLKCIDFPCCNLFQWMSTPSFIHCIADGLLGGFCFTINILAYVSHKSFSLRPRFLTHHDTHRKQCLLSTLGNARGYLGVPSWLLVKKINFLYYIIMLWKWICIKLPHGI